MSGKRMHGVVRSVRRFFWLPRGTPQKPAPLVPSLLIWGFCLVAGAVAAAAGWVEGPVVRTLAAVWCMLDDVIEGVRHRWPAFAAGLAVCWGVNRLAHLLVPDSDSQWGEYAVYAATTLAALAMFVAVSRLPLRRSQLPM